MGDLSLRIICVRRFALFACFARRCFVKSEEVIIVSCREPRANAGQIAAFNFVHGPKQMQQGKRNTIYTVYSNPICADKTRSRYTHILHKAFAKVGLKPVLLSEKTFCRHVESSSDAADDGCDAASCCFHFDFLYLSGIKLA